MEMVILQRGGFGTGRRGRRLRAADAASSARLFGSAATRWLVVRGPVSLYSLLDSGRSTLESGRSTNRAALPLGGHVVKGKTATR